MEPFIKSLYPITKTLTFANASIEQAANTYYEFLEKVYHNRDDTKFKRSIVSSINLETLLKKHLLPLRKRRFTKTIFIQTTNPKWAAIFNNDWASSDAAGYTPPQEVNNQKIGLRYITLMYSTPEQTHYPGTIFRI